MTAFLWHLTAMFVATAVVTGLGLAQPAVGSAAWWLLRPLWLAVLALFTAVTGAALPRSPTGRGRDRRGRPGRPALGPDRRPRSRHDPVRDRDPRPVRGRLRRAARRPHGDARRPARHATAVRRGPGGGAVMLSGTQLATRYRIGDVSRPGRHRRESVRVNESRPVGAGASAAGR